MRYLLSSLSYEHPICLLIGANLWTILHRFSQRNIDDMLALDIEFMRCDAFGGVFPLGTSQCRGMLNLCISDDAKKSE